MNEKLQDVQWGEYRLGDIFDSATGDFDIQKKHIHDRGEYVITAGLTNNGVLGKSDIKAKIFKSKFCGDVWLCSRIVECNSANELIFC